MGTNLHRQNVAFFSERMDEHTAVSGWDRVEPYSDYVFIINRRRYRGIKILLTDAYRFSEAEALLMPDGIDYVLMGAPHASYDDELRRMLAERKIGLGHIGKFMGAINKAKFWEHRTPAEIEMDDEDGVVWPP